jgi:hypothetical protein
MPSLPRPPLARTGGARFRHLKGSDSDRPRTREAKLRPRGKRGRPEPLDGEEYLDLEDLEQGVRSALGAIPPMGNMLLRRSVHKDTWAKIQKQLAALHTAKSH